MLIAMGLSDLDETDWTFDSPKAADYKVQVSSLHEVGAEVCTEASTDAIFEWF